MIVSPERLVPSQDFLKPHTVAYIFECIKKGETGQLPPDPIVRAGENGELIAIDGHNLIAVMLHRGEALNVHVAASAQDGLPPTSAANIHRNKDLKEKFETVLLERTRVRDEGIASFKDLIDRFPDLFKS